VGAHATRPSRPRPRLREDAAHGPPAEPASLRPRLRVPRLRGRGDDHGRGPARRRRSHRQVLALGPPRLIVSEGAIAPFRTSPEDSVARAKTALGAGTFRRQRLVRGVTRFLRQARPSHEGAEREAGRGPSSGGGEPSSYVTHSRESPPSELRTR